MKHLHISTIAKSMAILSSATVIAISFAPTATARTGDVVVPTTSVQVSLPTPTAIRQVAQRDDAALARQAHNQINRYRQRRGLRPLQWSDAIAAQARRHSEAMAQGRSSFGHSGFSKRVRAIRLPFRGAAENVAYNQGYRNPVKVAVKGWLKSPGHKSNIEGRFDKAGIGVARNAKGEIYFTQVFLRSR